MIGVLFNFIYEVDVEQHCLRSPIHSHRYILNSIDVQPSICLQYFVFSNYILKRWGAVFKDIDSHDSSLP